MNCFESQWAVVAYWQNKPSAVQSAPCNQRRDNCSNRLQSSYCDKV